VILKTAVVEPQRTQGTQTQVGGAASRRESKRRLTPQGRSPITPRWSGAWATTEGTIKVTVHRLRQRYRERLRAVVSQTVSNPIEVDAEIAHLLEALRG
jgi:hypothetical protein